MKANHFNPDVVAAGSKESFWLELFDDAAHGFPVVVINGAQAGKTLVAIAGVHGDEYEGVQALHELCATLDPAEMNGRLIAVPIANVAAHRAAVRTTPMDSLNLARVFPGNDKGTLTERIAACLTRLIERADFLLDLHSAGIMFQIPPLVGYCAANAPAAAAARVFGTPVIWAHPEPIPAGRTVSEAQRVGIPWLYVESSGGGRVLPHELPYYQNGIRHLLQHLRLLPGEPPAASARYSLAGNGNLDEAIAATAAGFFVPQVPILAAVTAGQMVGVIRDLFGDTLEEITAPQAGFVIVLRALPPVNPGDTVCVVTSGVRHD